MSDDHGGSSGSSRPSGTEWAVGVLGGLAVLALLGFLAYQAVAVADEPAALRAQATAVERTPAGYVTTVRVRNVGGQTAQDVHLTGELTRDGTRVDSATATLPYVPARSEREATLVFGTDPATADLSVTATGFGYP